MSNQPAPTASTIGPCPTVTQIVGRPGTGSLPSTIAPIDPPPSGEKEFREANKRIKKAVKKAKEDWIGAHYEETETCLKKK